MLRCKYFSTPKNYYTTKKKCMYVRVYINIHNIYDIPCKVMIWLVFPLFN